MEIYRGPHTGSGLECTDSRKPKEYVAGWQDGHGIGFDGTIDKGGERHTWIQVHLNDDDVVALMNALVKRDRKKKAELETELRQSQKETDTLCEALQKIYFLVEGHANDAPSPEALIQAVSTIAVHFCWGLSEGYPKIDWVKWKSL